MAVFNINLFCFNAKKKYNIKTHILLKYEMGTKQGY